MSSQKVEEQDISVNLSSALVFRMTKNHLVAWQYYCILMFSALQ